MRARDCGRRVSGTSLGVSEAQCFRTLFKRTLMWPRERYLLERKKSRKAAICTAGDADCDEQGRRAHARKAEPL